MLCGTVQWSYSRASGFACILCLTLCIFSVVSRVGLLVIACGVAGQRLSSVYTVSGRQANAIGTVQVRRDRIPHANRGDGGSGMAGLRYPAIRCHNAALKLPTTHGRTHGMSPPQVPHGGGAADADGACERPGTATADCAARGLCCRAAGADADRDSGASVPEYVTHGQAMSLPRQCTCDGDTAHQTRLLSYSPPPESEMQDERFRNTQTPISQTPLR